MIKIQDTENVLVKLLAFLLLSDSTPTIAHKKLLQLKDLANKGKSGPG